MSAGLLALLLAGVQFAAPAIGHGADPGIAAALELYQYRLVRTGMRVRGYPPEALRAGWTGTAVLEVRVGAHGAYSGARLIQSSGHAVLDEHAAELLAQAVPLTEIPSALQNRPFVVRVAIVFALPSQD